MSDRRKKVGLTALFFVLLIVGLHFVTLLVTPKFVTDVKEGALIREYYASDHNHDVIFVGDCEVFESFVPSFLEENYGIKSFVRGSAAQRIWQSYYLMKETLNYEKPKIFVLSVQELMYGQNAKEEYNRMTLDGMRWSKEKIESIRASMNEEERFLDYLFPLLRYKERIFDLKEEDIQYLFRKERVSDRGYLKNTGVLPMGDLPPIKPLGDYTLPEKAMVYLDKITKLCKEMDIKLILVKAPIPYPYWYAEWEEQVKLYAKENELPYLNYLEKMQETGINMATDTYDAGLHLNYNGAIKLSTHIGKVLSGLLQEP